MKSKQSVLFRIIALMLSVMLLVGVVPATVYAEGDQNEPLSTDPADPTNPPSDPTTEDPSNPPSEPSTEDPTDPPSDPTTEDPTGQPEDPDPDDPQAPDPDPSQEPDQPELKAEVALFDSENNPIPENSYVQKVDHVVIKLPKTSVNWIDGFDEDYLSDYIAAGFVSGGDYSNYVGMDDIDSQGWVDTDEQDRYITYEASGDFYVVTLNIVMYLQRNTLSFSDFEGDVVAFASVDNTVLIDAQAVIDVTEPQLNVDDIPSEWQEKVTVSFSTSDNYGVSSVYYTKSGQTTALGSAAGSYTFDITEKAAEGDYTIYAVDEAGNESSVSLGAVLIDKAAPQIEVESYSNTDLQGNQRWSDGSQKITVTLKITDAESGIDEEKFTIDGTAYTPEKSGDNYIFTLSEADQVRADAVIITAYDKAGKHAEFTTQPLLIDSEDPQGSDIDAVIEAVETNKLLNILTFGLYHNDDLKLTVKVSANGGSPINSIRLYDGDEEIEADSDLAIDSGLYVRDFILGTQEKKFNLYLVVTDTVGRSSSRISILDIAHLSSDDKDLKSKVSDGVYELVATKLVPGAIWQASGEPFVVNDGYTVHSGYVDLSLSLTDELSGIAEITGYFNRSDKFTDNGDGTYTVDSSVRALSIPVEYEYGTGALSEKKISAELLYTVPDTASSGAYTFLAVVTNNSGTESCYAYQVYIDNSEPVLSELEYSRDWSNQPILVSFKVKDVPEIGSGISSVTIVDKDNVAIARSKIIDNGDGSYSFNADKNTEYTITATDRLGHVSSSALKATVSTYDTGAPSATISGYSNKDSGAAAQTWTKDPVTISFKASDVAAAEGGTAVSGIKSVSYSDPDGNIRPLGVMPDGNYSFNVTKRGVYTIRVVDNADNEITIDTDEILYDDYEPQIVRIVFREATEKDVKSFGLYKNQAVMADVYVKSVGGAPIAGIDIKNHDDSLDEDGSFTDGVVPVEGEENVYCKSFAIPESDESYHLTISAITETGKAVSVEKFSEIDVYLEDQKLLNINKDLFEVVITTAKPIIGDFIVTGMTSGADAGGSGNTLYSGNSGTLSATIQDDLAGIDKDTLAVMLDGTSITDKVDYEFDTEKKVTQLSLTYTLENPLNSGKHTFTVAVKNLAGNERETEFTFYVDNTAPVISDVTYDGNAAMTKWTTDTVLIAFTADDTMDALPYGGVDKATFVVTGSLNHKTYAVEQDETGRYYFTADLHQAYTVSVQDAFGNQSEEFTISAEDVLIDTEAPHVGNILYNGKTDPKEVEVTADGVTVSFYAHDRSEHGEWLSGRVDGEGNPALEIKIVALVDGGEVGTINADDLTCAYSVENDFFEYSFVSKANYSYQISVTDAARNTTVLTTEQTIYDETDPRITGYKVEKGAGGALLSILTFGAYSNDKIILTVYAADDDPSAGIASITAVYDGEELKTSGELESGYNAYSGRYDAQQSFIIPISKSAYDPEKLDVTVTDKVTLNGSNKLSDVSNENKDKDDNSIIQKPFEIVSTKEPVTIGDITVEYQQRSVENPDENKVNVYSADINKTSESADGRYKVTIDDTLSGIDSATVKVYFDLADKFVEKDGVATPNGAAEIEAAAELDLNKYTIKYTKDATLTEKIIGADIDYLTPSSLATGRYIFLVEATNNSGNPISKYAAIYLDNTNPAFVGGFTYSNTNEDGVQQWTNDEEGVTVSFTVTDDPDGYGYYGGIAKIEVVSNNPDDTNTYSINQDTITKTQNTYSFVAKLYQTYTVTVTDAFGRTAKATTDFVLYDNESTKISNFTYDGYENAGEAPWQNKDKGMVVTFDLDDRSDLPAISGTWLSGMAKESNSDTNISNLTVKVTGNTDNEEYVPECSYDDVKKVFTYSFTSRSFQTYTVEVTDPAGNSSSETSAQTKVDTTAPYVVKYNVRTEEQNKVLNILSFGIYSNSVLVLSVEAEDAEAACGIQNIIATYDGKELEVYDALEVSDGERTGLNAATSTATKSFIIPVDDKSAYDPTKLHIQVTDRVGNDSDRDMDALNADKDVEKYDETVNKPFEVVSTKTPATINDIEINYQNGYSVNPDENKVNVYSAFINKSQASADGNYKVKIEDALSGIDAKSVKVYFDSADKFTEVNGVATPNGASEVQVNNSDFIQLNSYTIRYTKDGTLKDKIVAADIEYLTPSSLATGRYIFLVEATNNSGNPISKYAAIYLDNTDPAFVGGFTYSNTNEDGVQQWTNEKVTVGFTVTDDPDGYGYYGGVAKIEVVGDKDGKSYLSLEGEAVDRVSKPYSFIATLYQTYTVTVTDVFGRTAEATTDLVLYDNEITEIKRFTYDGKIKADNAEWKNKTDGMLVTFDLDDRSLVDAISGTWLSGMAKNNNVDTNNSNLTVKVTGNTNKQTYTPTWKYDEARDVFTYSFKADFYQTYTVEVIDPAGNSSDATSAETKVDTAIPEITNVSFRKEESTASKILNFLTFGLYSDMKIVMTVEITDQAASSGIDEIHVFYEGKELTAYGEGEIKDGTPENIGDGVKATREFLIEDQVLDARKIIISATDHVGYAAVEKSLHKLNQENKVESKENGIGITKFDDSFEVVSSAESAKIDGIVFDPKYVNLKGNSVDTSRYTDEDGNKYFSGHVKVSAKVTAPETGLHTLNVVLNSTLISQYCYYFIDDPNNLKPFPVKGNNSAIPDDFTHFNQEPSGEKLTQITVVFFTDDVQERTGGILRDKTAKNIISISGHTNNGQIIPKATEDFFIFDNSSPSVTGFRFGSDGDVSEENESGKNVEVTSYGYYFIETTDVYVSAADANTNGVKGSGVKNIHFYGNSIDQLESKNVAETFVEASSFVTLNDGIEYAVFTVPAGFKGRVFAYAIDNVDNIGDIVTPDGLIVESADQHTRASDAAIKVNTEPVGKDPQGHPLFNGPVSVTMEVSDTYSGIERIVYAITDYNDNTTEYEAVIGNDGSVVSDADGNSAWEIVDTEKNLATRLVKTIVISPENYNCNNIRVSLKAYDRAGHPIIVPEDQEPIFSIDTKEPEISVSYDPEPATHVYNGMNYFSGNRTATITVKERNFDPNDFKINTITAIEGTVPVLVPAKAWTSYTDFSNDMVEHRATVTFDTDGKFWVQLEYTDLAKNPAAHYGPTSQISDSRDIFCIDKTAPTVALSLSSAAVPSNGNYYNRTVVADIAVTEHNFDPSYVVTMIPDYYDSTNVTAITGPDIVWDSSSSGDVHHGTVTFTEQEYDGKFSFRFKYKDLADNESAEAVQNIFYVDSLTDRPAINEVTDSTPYEDDVAPRIVLSDPNFDINNYTITVTKYKYDVKNLKVIEEVYSNNDGENTLGELGTFDLQSNENGDTGVIFYFNDIEKTDENDGIYVIKSFYTDLAGNVSQQSVLTFSVNRFGAVFIPGNDATKQLINGYYTNQPSDVVIKEINVNKLEKYELTLSYNSGNVALSEDDYTITEKHNDNEWYEYTYTIKASKFEKEGEYTVTITSVDEFGNTVSNRTAADTSETQRTCPVLFKVDKTAPEITITGIVDGQDYSEDSRVVHIVCVDENIDKTTLKVFLNDRELTLDQLRDEFGAEIDDTMIGELDVSFTVRSGGEEIIHTLRVTISDLANNEGESDSIRFTLSATFWTLYFHSPLALILTGVGLLALIGLAAFLIRRKRKNAVA